MLNEDDVNDLTGPPTPPITNPTNQPNHTPNQWEDRATPNNHSPPTNSDNLQRSKRQRGNTPPPSFTRPYYAPVGGTPLPSFRQAWSSGGASMEGGYPNTPATQPPQFTSNNGSQNNYFNPNSHNQSFNYNYQPPTVPHPSVIPQPQVQPQTRPVTPQPQMHQAPPVLHPQPNQSQTNDSDHEDIDEELTNFMRSRVEYQLTISNVPDEITHADIVDAFGNLRSFVNTLVRFNRTTKRVIVTFIWQNDYEAAKQYVGPIGTVTISANYNPLINHSVWYRIVLSHSSKHNPSEEMIIATFQHNHNIIPSGTNISTNNNRQINTITVYFDSEADWLRAIELGTFPIMELTSSAPPLGSNTPSTNGNTTSGLYSWRNKESAWLSTVFASTATNNRDFYKIFLGTGTDPDERTIEYILKEKGDIQPISLGVRRNRNDNNHGGYCFFIVRGKDQMEKCLNLKIKAKQRYWLFSLAKRGNSQQTLNNQNDNNNAPGPSRFDSNQQAPQDVPQPPPQASPVLHRAPTDLPMSDQSGNSGPAQQYMPPGPPFNYMYPNPYMPFYPPFMPPPYPNPQ